MKALLQKYWPFLTLFGICLGVWGMYKSSVFFGFIWDDPVWYGHALGKRWWESLQPTTAFQFYRPLSMLYVWLFLRPDGTFAVEWLHRFQIGFHLINIWLAYLLSRRLGLARATAVAVSALFAVYPFLYQAVAWAAPNQPSAAVVQNLALLAYLAARPLPALKPQPSGRRFWVPYSVSLVLFFLALMVQESSTAVAIVPLLYEVCLRQPIRTWREGLAIIKAPLGAGWMWALLFPLAGAAYFAVWLQVPRQAGLTGAFFDGRNLTYLLQGFIYPLLAWPGGYAADFKISQFLLMGLATAVIGLLLLLARRRQRGRVVLFGLSWAAVSLLPFWVGLEFSYISLASRLFYAPALGICLLWGSALWPRAAERTIIRIASIGALLFIGLQSIWLLWQFQQMWQAGTDHLQTAVSVLHQEANSRVLFLNFPDRFTPKREPFPVGYWGLTLAPVVVDVDAFPPILLGPGGQSISRSLPWLGQQRRETGPYQVDMRGVIVEPDALVELARTVDAVYRTRYLPDGRFQLEYAGFLETGEAGDCETAVFDGMICLHDVILAREGEQLEVTMFWSTTEALPAHITIFTHLGHPGQPPVAQADGDTWRRALPLANWQAGDLIIDQRTIPLAEVMPGMVLQIGVYNWVEGNRLPGMAVVDERPLPDDAWRMSLEE